VLRDPAWLPEGRLLRLSSFGERLALADLYWLALVQYIGETVIAKAQRWNALYPLADLVTDLDPRYGYAYQVAGSNLAGLALLYDQADAILQKGMRNVPGRWTLPWTYATNKFLYQGDFRAAAEYARRAAEVGKRPELALLAANLSAVVNSDDEYRTALAFLDESIEQAGTLELRDELVQRRSKIATYQVLARVEQAVARFRTATGRFPFDLLELITSGELRAPPGDPSGGEILYEPSTGKVSSSVWGARAPLRVTAR